jgi:hypothetical protein
MRFAVLSLLVFAGTSFACTVETTSSSGSTPGTPGTDPAKDVGSKPPTDTTPKEEEPWRDWSLPSEVRTITCPTSDTVHVATAKGVYSLVGDKWEVVAPGDFNAVHLHDAKTGFAAGDGLLWQRSEGKWYELDGAKGYKISAVFSNAEGAYLVGSGFQYIGKNGLPVEPKVMFVANDLSMRPERSYGHRLTAGTITSIAGTGSTVAIGGSLTMMYSSGGSEWQPFGEDYYLTGTIRSVAVTKFGLYATNGSEVAMPGGVHYERRSRT